MESWINRILTKPAMVFALILFVYLAGNILHTCLIGQSIYGDGAYYFSWLHSIVVNHTINLTKTYKTMGLTFPLSPTGLPGNKYAIGPALAWLPSYTLIYHLFDGTGFTILYHIVAGITGVLYSVSGLVFLYLILTRFTSHAIALLTIISITFATNLLFYGSIDTVNSHSISFFFSSLLIYVLFQKRISWIMAGGALAGLFLTRPQDIVLILLVIPFTHSVRSICSMFIPLVFAFALQYSLWFSLYGMTVSPYFSSGEYFSFLHPHIIAVLFAPSYGLFTTHPILLASCYGFLPSWNIYEKVKKWIIIICLIQLYLVASWSTWWQGATFGGRMFVSVLPLLVLPMAITIEQIVAVYKKPVYYVLYILMPLTFLNCIRIVYLLAIS